MLASQHSRNDARLALLRRYEIVDTAPEREFDEVVELVAELLQVPIALVSLVDADRQWFKASVGFAASCTPIENAICAHAILEDELLEISDTTLDPRTRDNPLVTGPEGVRFYAGVVLRGDDDLPLGTLCVIDQRPRTLNPLERQVLCVMGRQVMRQIELRRASRQQDLLRREIDHRVKNSLASVSALIGLQAAGLESAEAKDLLADVRRRLSATIALHEELHRAGAGSTVQIPRFLDRVTHELRALLPDGIAIETALDPFDCSAEGASSIGLIVNEFVANAGKYAFPDGRGSIRIVGRREDNGDYSLVCRDDGIASQDSLDAAQVANGLGMKIINVAANALGAVADWSLAEPGLQLAVRVTRTG